MASGGIEIIIGGRTDPQFGKLILLGLGGIYVEVFKDFALSVCPITKVRCRGHDRPAKIKGDSHIQRKEH